MFTHAYCPQLRPMCTSCGAPVPEGGEGVPEICMMCCKEEPQAVRRTNCPQCSIEVHKVS